MEIKKENSWKKFIYWAIGATTLASIIGSSIYIYKKYTRNNHFQNKDKFKLIDKENKLDDEYAIEIITRIHELSEESYMKSFKEWEENRRAAINNKVEYENICKTISEYKEYMLNKYTEFAIENTNIDSIEEVHKVLKNIKPLELEKRAFAYWKPNFEDKIIPDKEAVKKAFLYYGDIFKEERKDIQRVFTQNLSFDEEENDMILLKLITLKYKVEDLVYLKFNYTEREIRFLLYEYDLFNDEEVRKVHDDISKFDEMMSPIDYD